SRCRPAPCIEVSSLLAALVFEGYLDFCAVRLDLAVLELDIQLHHLGDPQVAKRLPGACYGGTRRLLPRYRAGADQFDDLIDVLSHVHLRLLWTFWGETCDH